MQGYFNHDATDSSSSRHAKSNDMITGIDFIVNDVLPEELTTHLKHLTAHYSFPTVLQRNEANINGCKKGKHSPVYN